MSTRQIVCYVAVCGVCRASPDEGYHWDDPQVAVEYMAEEDDWTLTDNGQLVCGVSDTAHYLVRGHESPVLLAPGPDAMSISYGKEAA